MLAAERTKLSSWNRAVVSSSRLVVSVLSDEDPYAREAAATALGAMGGAAATDDILRALTTALLDTDQYVHEAALAALRTLQPLHQEGNGPTSLV